MLFLKKLKTQTDFIEYCIEYNFLRVSFVKISFSVLGMGRLVLFGELGAASQGLHTEISISCRLRLWSEHLYCLRDGLVATKRGILATRLQPMMMKDDAGWMNGLEWKPWQDYKTKLTAFL